MIKKMLFTLTIILFFNNLAMADNELDTRKSIQNKTLALFEANNFDALEALAKKYSDPKQRTSSGLWKLSIFYDAFNNNYNKSKHFWSKRFKKINKWISNKPNSPTAHIIKAQTLKSKAWSYRGIGTANTVPKDAWKPFKEGIKASNKYLDKIKSIAKNNPQWYVVKIQALTDLGGDDIEFRRTINEGMRKHPLFYEIYFAAVRYMTPMWHGDADKIEALAKKAVNQTKKTDGMGMYARIYWFASHIQYDQGALFHDSDMDWSNMKKGMFDVLEQYPDQWNIQNFAYFSCIAMHLRKDQQTVKTLLNKIEEPIYINVWRHRAFYSSCKSEALNIPLNTLEPYKNQ